MLVCKGYVVEHDVSLNGAYIHGVGSVFDFYRGIENLLITRESRHSFFKLFRIVGKTYQYTHQAGGVQHVCDKKPCFDFKYSRQNNDSEVHYRVHYFKRRIKLSHIVISLRLAFNKRLISLFKLLFFQFFVGKSLYDSYSAQSIFDLGVNFTHIFAVFMIIFVPLVIERDCQPHHKRNENENTQGHPWLLSEEDYKHSDNLHSADQQRFGTVVRKLGNIEQVGRNPAHEAARLVVVEKRMRKSLKMAEHITPQIALDFHTHNMSVLVDKKLARCADDFFDKQRDCKNQHYTQHHMSFGNGGIGYFLRVNRQNQIARRGNHGAQHVKNQQTCVGLVVRQKLAEVLPTVLLLLPFFFCLHFSLLICLCRYCRRFNLFVVSLF